MLALNAFFFVLSLAVLSSCEALADQETTATEWYVSLPSGDGESSDSDWTQYDVVKYTVTLTQNEVTVLQKDGYPGERITLNQLAPGKYTVSVNGFNEEEEVIATGTGEASLIAGQMADVTITLTMLQNRHVYTLSYNVNSKDSSIQGVIPASKTYRYRAEVPVNFPALTRTGYYFDGWNTASDGSGTAYRADDATTLTIGTADLTLYAQWVAYTYTVTFDKVAPLATGEMEAMTFTYDWAQNLTPCAFLRTGYVFVGWSLVNNIEGNERSLPSVDFIDKELVSNMTAVQNATVTLYAKWMARSDVLYTVEHYKQNLADDAYTLVGGDTETKTGIARMPTEAASKTYTGFTAQSFDQETISPDGDTVIKIYYDRNLYTVSYVSGGDVAGSSVSNLPETKKYRYQTEVYIPDTPPTRTNYTFYGYKCSDDNAIKTTGDRLIAEIDHDITLTAQWGQIGGIDIAIDRLGDLDVTAVISGNTVIFTAESGFTDYTWWYEETNLLEHFFTWATITGEKDEILTLDTSSWVPGIYEILLTAKDSVGNIHATSAQAMKQ